jgi:predicted nucleic acid-binding protein
VRSVPIAPSGSKWLMDAPYSAPVDSKAGAQEHEGRVKNGITFDTGALIALERRGQRARKVLERATEQKVRITVPAAVITEWWRSRNDIRERILAGVRVEPLSESVAKVAGEALAAVKGTTPIDAIVMASAAQRGDIVYTADVSALAKLAGYFQQREQLGGRRLQW